MDQFSLTSKILKEDVSPQSASFMMNLQKLNNKIRKVPDVRSIILKPVGELFCVYYLSKGKPNFVFRITSKDKIFKNIYSIDICDKKWNAKIGCIFKSNPSINEIRNVLGAFTEPTVRKSIEFSIKVKTKISNWKSAFKKFITSKIQKEGVILERRLSIDDIMAFTAVTSAAFILIALFYFFRARIQEIQNYKEEQEAEKRIEKEINESLFSKQRENDPAFIDYYKLISFIKNTVNGTFPATIICGPPGTGKTYITRRTFYFMKLRPQSDYVIEKGATAGLADIYQMLYDSRKRILVLDDFDAPLKDSNTVNFLKSITDSYSRRIISMPRERELIGGGQQQGGESVKTTPRKFEYKGKMIIITNIDRNQLDSALLSRCPTTEIKFDIKKMKELLIKMYTYVLPDIDIKIKKEVLDYIFMLYNKHPKMELSFRTYQNCVSARVVNPEEWKDMISTILSI